MKRFVIGMIIALCVSVSGSLSCFAYENAVYTENELKIAKERLSENREVLDITSIVGISFHFSNFLSHFRR